MENQALDLFIEDMDALLYQQELEREQWLESEEGIAYVNQKLIDAAYEDQYEIDVEV